MPGARILAVEDVQDNLDLMSYLLTAFGHVVFPATSGRDALELGVRERLDLVLLDLQLPDATGFDILAAMRAEPALREVSIIAVTAYAMVGHRDRALAAGFDGYLTKPIDPITFSDSIDAWLPPALRGAQPRSFPSTTVELT